MISRSFTTRVFLLVVFLAIFVSWRSRGGSVSEN